MAEQYFEREGDYYFIVETLNGVPLGTYGIYNLHDSRAEIGRLVIRPGVSAGIPASLLLLDLFYGQMNVTQVRATSVQGNYGVHSLLRKYEFREVKVEHAGQVIGGEAMDMLYFVQTAEDWPRVRKIGLPRAQRAESGIRKWEQVFLESRGSEKPQR